MPILLLLNSQVSEEIKEHIIVVTINQKVNLFQSLVVKESIYFLQ